MPDFVPYKDRVTAVRPHKRSRSSMRSRPRHPLRTLSWRVSNAASGYRVPVCRSIQTWTRRLLFYPGWRRISAGFPPSISHTISFRRREMPSVSAPISTSPRPQCRALATGSGTARRLRHWPQRGWLAHAQEQYASPELIRPRARYVRDEPQSGTPLTAADASSRVGEEPLNSAFLRASA